MLYGLSLFAGTGIDLQLGTGHVEIGLDGYLSAHHPTERAEIGLGRGSVLLRQEGTPSFGKLRLFGGAQINLWIVKLFAQASWSTDFNVSLAAGIRVAW